MITRIAAVAATAVLSFCVPSAAAGPAAAIPGPDPCRYTDQLVTPLYDHAMAIAEVNSNCLEVPSTASIQVDLRDATDDIAGTVQLYLRAPDGSLYKMKTVGFDHRVYGVTDELGAEDWLMGEWKVYIRDTEKSNGGIEAIVQRVHVNLDA